MATYTNKDICWRVCKGNLETEIRDSKLQEKITGHPTTRLPAIIRFLGADFNFTTSINFFRDGNLSGQPFYHTSNLEHVVQKARQEGRRIETMMGVCIHAGASRFEATNGEFLIGPYAKFKELDAENGKFTVDQLMTVYLERMKVEFPGGKPDIGTIDDYHYAPPSALKLEPSIGKIIKFANYFEFARALGIPLTLTIPTQEYVDDNIPRLKPFDPSKMAKDVVFAADTLAKTIKRMQQIFFPDVELRVMDTRTEKCRRDLQTILDSSEFESAVRSLAPEKLSYASLYDKDGAYKEDAGWNALFLGVNGRIPLGDQDPSKIIFVHYRDFTSFALEAAAVYEKLAKSKGISWKDRVAVVGVSGAPELRMHNDNERRRRLIVGYRFAGDDYMAYPEVSLLLGDKPESIKEKVYQMNPAKSEMHDPMYFLIRAMHHYFYRENRAEMWLDDYPSQTPFRRSLSGKPILNKMACKLKEDLSLN